MLEMLPKQVQQLGRTHRSNQKQPPRYVILFTDLAGEHRFAGAVAKRLEQLGALTHGDRHAACQDALASFNVDDKCAGCLPEWDPHCVSS